MTSVRLPTGTRVKPEGLCTPTRGRCLAGLPVLCGPTVPQVLGSTQTRERQMKELAEKNRDKVIDVLNERLTFERAGVKLYDRILEVMKQSGDQNVNRMLDEMQEHRDEEKEHAEWLEEQIRALGGDAHARTEHSELVERESTGIEEVVMSDAELPHLFHALLAAELVDNAGWDLLVSLADEAGDREAKREFRKRMHEEADHLLLVRKAVQNFSMQEVLGEDVKMPRSGLGAALT
jgi:bacterioferritin (cytochrome b1)